MRILTVVGNRPQFIKSAPLSTALREAGIEELALHTGQHYDPELSQVFYDELGLAEPAYRLDLKSADPALMAPAIRQVVDRERPDWVLVFGDTNSTLAGAEAAGSVPLAHVEAGLRSFDLSMPEERNRIEVDRLSSLLLCPDERSAEQLASEGVTGRRVVVGDVMADASRIFAPVARSRSGILARIGVREGGYAVATIHRAANATAERLRAIAAGLARVPVPVFFPAHPRTRAIVDEARIDLGDGTRLLEPLGYLDFTALTSQAALVITDSGGLQKEAYWQRVPCVTVRPSTEWVDTVAARANVLVEPEGLAAAAEAALRAGFPADAPELYGDGHASERVVAALYPSAP